jgi:hypothetical protein
MDLLEAIRKSGKKSKELNTFVAKLIFDQKLSGKDFTAALASGNDSERGTCLEALEFATQKNPEIAKQYLPEIISSLTDKAPRVKWEAARVIGNIAGKFPAEAAKAVNNLFANTNDKGTVVRWSAAFALGEILKSSKDKSLLNKIEALSKKETNNGVKNVYLKALKLVQ